MKRVLCAGLLLGAACVSHAEVVMMVAVPSAWRLENYSPGQVVVWYSGSSCVNGQLTLPPTAPAADHGRLYATILAAKTTSAKVFVRYESTSPGCPIASFGMMEQ